MRLRAGIAIAVLIAVTLLLTLEIAAPVELPMRDLMLRSLSSRPATKTVVVAIDEQSLRAVGRWPWPRERLARIVDRAAEANARAVIFDVLLTDPSEDDERLASSMRKLPTAAVCVLVEREQWLIPAPPIASATVVAHGNFELDHDGILRRFSATKQNGARAYTALSFVAASFRRQVAVPVGRTVAPSFRTPPDSVPVLSAADVIREGSPALRDRIVFVGPTALGLGDRVLTPVSRRLAPDAGVTVHAAATESLPRGEVIRTLPPLHSGAIAAFLAFVLPALRRYGRAMRIGFPAFLLFVMLVSGRGWLADGIAIPFVTLTVVIVVITIAIEATEGRLTTARLQDIATRLAEERAQEVESKRVLAHELKTPLASMRGLTQLLGEFDLTDGERKRVTHLLQAEASKLQDMVQALLDLERLPLRDFASSSAVTDLGDLVSKRIELIRASTDRPLTLTADANLRVRADAMLLERVVDNLVGNALKYTDGPIDVNVTNAKDEALLEVADRGPGIAPADQQRIFHRFARGSTAAGTEGLGLGLSLVAEAARWHHGRVTLDTAPGGGSVFRVVLPVAQ